MRLNYKNNSEFDDCTAFYDKNNELCLPSTL